MAKQVDGVIAVSARMSDRALAEVAELTTLVLVNRKAGDVPAILLDMGGGMRQAIEHLHALGHRRCVYLNGPRASWSNRQRRTALRATAKRLGIATTELGPFEPSYEAGVHAADLALAEGPTAIVAYNDLMALGVVARLGGRGVVVPGDVSVVGFDDIHFAGMASPPLTTVAVPAAAAGRVAVDLLLDTIGHEPAGEREDYQLKTELRVRASTGPPPDAGRSISQLGRTTRLGSAAGRRGTMGGRITRWAATLAAMAGALAMGACADGPESGGGGDDDGRQGAQLAAEAARRAGDAQRPRRGGQPAAHQGGDREVPRREPEGRAAHHLHDRDGARAVGQGQGPAEGGPAEHRPRADRHRRPRGRHLAGPVAEGAARARRGARRALPRARGEDAGAGRGRRRLVTYYPSGPLLEYAPDRVSDPPTTPQALLAWAKENPGKFMYARPSNSGPARTFLMGLPYLLGDKDPRDPINGWDKTWAYLKELGKYVEYYPSGTKDTMSGLADGSRDMIPTTTGWDINPRALGTVPKGVKVAAFDDLHWVTDAHYMVVPKGIAEDKLAVVLDLMKFLLEPEQQALSYDDGYFYPGPAIKDVGIDMAPAKSQKVIEEFGRPEYEQLIESKPKETPLLGKALVDAFDKWDREVGGSKVKED